MDKVTVFDVAKYFLARVEVDLGSVITHLKLQKLCYYSQAWHLVFTDGEKMFDQKFEAWAHGPVCPELWTFYREYSWQAIPSSKDFNYDKFDKKRLETLEEVWNTYSEYDAKYLERLTHQEDPWIEARGTCLPGEACSTEIKPESMKEYYSKFLDA